MSSSKTPASSLTPNWLQQARDHWQWRGQARPPFAVEPGPNQVSVWDFPRPPRLQQDTREVVVRWGGIELLRSKRAVMVLETAHPPSFYIPWADVERSFFERAEGSSFCEWKGPASYWTLVNGADELAGQAWSYPKPLAGAEALADCVSFYPMLLDCEVDGERVTPQQGGFYGGWITPELVGPFKGAPGSTGW